MTPRDDKLGWLIRDPNNLVRGPFTHAEIMQFLKKKSLRPKTEIAQANSYWFAIEEKAEIDRFFSDAPPPDANAQAQDATSTLTESAVERSDPKIDATQVITLPANLQEPQAPKSTLTTEDNVQWLNDDYAEEFGITLEEPASSNADDILTRSTVKVDTLPSELQEVKTETPKSIQTVIRNQAIVSKKTQTRGFIQMNVANAPATTKAILEDSDGASSKSLAAKWIVMGVVLTSILLAAIIFFKIKSSHRITAHGTSKSVGAKSFEANIRRAFLFSDLELAKSVTAEISNIGKNGYLAALAGAMIKKNFLVDIDGAIANLNSARGASNSAKQNAEIDNLFAVYSADKDIVSATSHAKAALDAMPGESVYRYNFSLLEFLTGDADKAAKDLSEANSENTDRQLYSDILTLRGWISDSNKQPDAENLFQRALDLNPQNTNALLLLALHKLIERKPREAEVEFRKFVDSMPEVEVFHIENYRKIDSVQLTDRARTDLHALNGVNSGTRTLPASLAADAILSAYQNKLTESDKILDAALAVTPGNADLLKARAYLLWKEAKYDEIVDLLKDLPRDQRNSFGYNLIIGMAYEKMGKYALAIRSYQALTDIDPERSESWSLNGEAQWHLKQNIEAKENFLRAIKKNPTDVRALQGLFNLGDESVIDNPDFVKLMPF